MRIFNFLNYREYLKARNQQLPQRGRGEVTRLSRALNIPQPQMSQILSEDRNLNLEQADLLSDYLDFTRAERTYLYTLVQIERAGRPSLRHHFIQQRDEQRVAALQIAKVISVDRKLNETEKAVFYSSWLYQAVRLLTSIEKNPFNTVDKISTHLSYDREKVDEIMQFLLSTGLCIQEKNNIVLGPKSTHLETNSPHLARHHTNWRQKAIQKHDKLEESDLIYTAPMTISKNDFKILREEILGLIKSVHLTVGNSSSEDLVCLNIDFFKVT